MQHTHSYRENQTHAAIASRLVKSQLKRNLDFIERNRRFEAISSNALSVLERLSASKKQVDALKSQNKHRFLTNRFNQKYKKDWDRVDNSLHLSRNVNHFKYDYVF